MKSISLFLVSMQEVIDDGGPSPYSMPYEYLEDMNRLKEHIDNVYGYLYTNGLSSSARLISKISDRIAGELEVSKYGDPGLFSLTPFNIVVHII